MRSLAPTLVVLACTLTPVQAQILADFKTKRNDQDFGTFTVLLDHLYSPHAVANFIRLAEGLVPRLDSEDGTIRTGPFYDGLAFDGMTANQEVTSGSPSDDQTGGPGYFFRDDFRSNQEYFPQFAIYMDNDGPNLNGSRFFINLTAALNPGRQSLGHRYTRFGEVIQQTNPLGGNGRATVAAISLSAPGIDTIDTVTMRYLGPDAQIFRAAVEDPNHVYLSTLPTVEPAVFSFRRTPTSLFLDWDDTPGSVARLWSSFDLHFWLAPIQVANVPGGDQFGYDLSDTIELAPALYFRGGTIRYPDWPSTDGTLPNRTLRTNFFDPALGSFTSTYSFNETGRAGLYSSALGNGSFEVTDDEVLGPFARRLELTPTSGNQPVYRFILHNDLAWSSQIPSQAVPIEANPSRLDGQNLANPGNPLVGGSWGFTN